MRAHAAQCMRFLAFTPTFAAQALPSSFTASPRIARKAPPIQQAYRRYGARRTMSTPIPITLCGVTEKVGSSVIAGLQPEYEVVHFVMGLEAAPVELPVVLQGLAVPSPRSSIGSGNISSVARVVILGGAFDEATVESLHSLCTQTSGARTVPWLRQDTTKPTPPLGPEYGKAMVQRTKEALKRLVEEGRLDGNDGGVYYY